MPYSSVEFEVTEDASGHLRVASGDVLSALRNALEQGEVQIACRLYEESGRAVAERLLAQVQAGSHKLREAAARMFAAARDFGRAARLYEHARHWPDAAQLYSEAADFAAAARCFKKAGDLFHAAQCLDAAGQVDEAIALYDELKEGETAAECLQRNGRYFEAAARYRALGSARNEVDALRHVEKGSKHRLDAVKRLAQLLASRNRLAEATELVVEALQEDPEARGDLELHQRLADLFEQQGFPEHAERARHRLQRLQKRKDEADKKQKAQEQALLAGHTVVGAVSSARTSSERRRMDAAAELAATPSEGYELLKGVPLFARLSIDELRVLWRMAAEVSFKPGAALVEINTDPPGLLVVLEGSAEVHAVNDGGQMRHLNSLGAGAYLGEISLMSGTVTSARVVASSFVRALQLGRDKFDRFLQSHPTAALRIYRVFAQNLGERVRALSTV